MHIYDHIFYVVKLQNKFGIKQYFEVRFIFPMIILLALYESAFRSVMLSSVQNLAGCRCDRFMIDPFPILEVIPKQHYKEILELVLNKRNWVFVTNSKFQISISLKPIDVNFWYFKLRLFDMTEFIIGNI